MNITPSIEKQRQKEFLRIARFYRILNVCIRFVTLGARFFLVFFLAKYLSSESVGNYGLFTATVTYSMYAVGLDFYTYSAREINKYSKDKVGQLLKSQAVLAFLLYLVFGPLLLLVFNLEFLDWSLAPWFYLLLILEHVNQELARLHIAQFRPVLSSLVMFVRSGLWVITAVSIMYLYPEFRSIEFVFANWTVGAILALLTSIYALSSEKFGGWHLPVDWAWLKKGVKVTIILLLASLSLRGIMTIDRYWFQVLNSAELLGVYVLFIGICNSLMAFLDAGVFAFTYPSLIKAHNDGQQILFRQLIIRLLVQTTILTCCFALLSWIVLPYILHWIGKPLYIGREDLFLWLLLGTSLFAMSMVPHYVLYARGLDKHILTSQLIGVAVFLLSTMIFTHYSRVEAVPLGLCLAYLSILIWKLAACYLLKDRGQKTDFIH